MNRARRALLDVNVLIALFTESHIHHDVAHDWFADHQAGGWATCALTENGFLRILSHPGAEVEADRTTLFASLRRLCTSPHHEFWPDAVSLRDESLFDSSVIVSHRQLTDVYLLGLATRMGGTLATFDGSIPRRAVRGATGDSITLIAPGEPAT
jgi:toxin-antitoxin system PIN domain toxin